LLAASAQATHALPDDSCIALGVAAAVVVARVPKRRANLATEADGQMYQPTLSLPPSPTSPTSSKRSVSVTSTATAATTKTGTGLGRRSRSPSRGGERVRRRRRRRRRAYDRQDRGPEIFGRSRPELLRDDADTFLRRRPELFSSRPRPASLEGQADALKWPRRAGPRSTSLCQDKDLDF